LYANCTIVDGNLEIVFIESTQHDFSFLRSIREVMGYVLIVSVFVDVIPLENLRVIRGRTQYQISASTSYYSLFVAINGFTRLPLVSLHGRS
jgi:epidermal growth factor receptor